MTIAALTMVHNEAVFLPLWLDHYGGQFGLQNLFVIDDGSTDGSTGDPRIMNLVGKRRSPLDEDDRAALISAFHAELLRHYEIVLYTDADEFIAVDPDAGPSLADYIRRHPFSCRAPIGLEVLHRRPAEGPIDFGRELFGQRRFVRFDIEYSKPLISRVPVRWQVGFHHCDRPYAIDCSLALFHLRSVDHDVSRRRIAVLNAVGFSQNALRRGHSHQFRLDPERYLALLHGTTEEAFDRAPTREPEAMLRAYREHGDRTPCRLDPRWSGSLRLGAVAARHGPQRPSPIGGDQLQRLFDASLDRMIAGVPERPRNEACPCGSGRRFKHCHAPSSGG